VRPYLKNNPNQKWLWEWLKRLHSKHTTLNSNLNTIPQTNSNRKTKTKKLEIVNGIQPN
jgi:hypothetical protein